MYRYTLQQMVILAPSIFLFSGHLAGNTNSHERSDRMHEATRSQGND